MEGNGTTPIPAARSLHCNERVVFRAAKRMTLFVKQWLVPDCPKTGFFWFCFFFFLTKIDIYVNWLLLDNEKSSRDFSNSISSVSLPGTQKCHVCQGACVEKTSLTHLIF